MGFKTQVLSVALSVLALPLEGFAGSHEARALSRRHSSRFSARANTNNTVSAGRQYNLQDYYRGESFLNDWNFFSSPDPTHGNVNYQTRENAIRKNLTYVQADGTTVLAVDDFSWVPVGGNRDSVRISTKKKYNGGLFIADFWKMPHGCSVWPAYWSVGPNWPAGGEIDVFEGVHDQDVNQYTLHTGPGCTLDTGNFRTLIKTNILHDRCESSGLDNRGCAFADVDKRSYGTDFNNNAGGVYAHLWDKDGIKMWFFPRGEIPADIEAQNPNPASWPTPKAFFSSRSCDTSKFFYEHELVIDTTLCGDWAGATYNAAGCPGSCAEAVSKPENFKWAKWKINYIAVYQ